MIEKIGLTTQSTTGLSSLADSESGSISSDDGEGTFDEYSYSTSTSSGEEGVDCIEMTNPIDVAQRKLILACYVKLIFVSAFFFSLSFFVPLAHSRNVVCRPKDLKLTQNQLEYLGERWGKEMVQRAGSSSCPKSKLKILYFKIVVSMIIKGHYSI